MSSGGLSEGFVALTSLINSYCKIQVLCDSSTNLSRLTEAIALNGALESPCLSMLLV